MSRRKGNALYLPCGKILPFQALILTLLGVSLLRFNALEPNLFFPFQGSCMLMVPTCTFHSVSNGFADQLDLCYCDWNPKTYWLKPKNGPFSSHNLQSQSRGDFSSSLTDSTQLSSALSLVGFILRQVLHSWMQNGQAALTLSSFYFQTRSQQWFSVKRLTASHWLQWGPILISK